MKNTEKEKAKSNDPKTQSEANTTPDLSKAQNKIKVEAAAGILDFIIEISAKLQDAGYTDSPMEFPNFMWEILGYNSLRNDYAINGKKLIDSSMDLKLRFVSIIRRVQKEIETGKLVPKKKRKDTK